MAVVIAANRHAGVMWTIARQAAARSPGLRTVSSAKQLTICTELDTPMMSRRTGRTLVTRFTDS